MLYPKVRGIQNPSLKGPKPQSTELTRGPPELVKHKFSFIREVPSAQERCMS